mmetsp:Transcript_7441/g.13287  ORF Transcript_7441/g.13287 Transcript_7441/m.13287 type:complete len:84 (+) Transcript_7441:1135-1386(+)
MTWLLGRNLTTICQASPPEMTGKTAASSARDITATASQASHRPTAVLNRFHAAPPPVSGIAPQQLLQMHHCWYARCLRRPVLS